MENLRLQELLKRYLDDVITELEQEELWGYVNDPFFDAEIKKLIGQAFDQQSQGIELDAEEQQRLLESIYGNDEVFIPTPRRLWRSISVAATIIIALSATLIFYLKDTRKNPIERNAYKDDILPGKQGATLTLANGKQIKLSDAINGIIAKEDGINVTKTAEGELIYELKKRNVESEMINTLSTAKGETYMLTLPDKSKVWLNSASSLTYVAGLNEKGLRRVKLKGEAYFEISKDKTRPFVVETAQQQVEVLGTHFNISNYADGDAAKTTLLEGSIRLRTGKSGGRVLVPGQQAILKNEVIQVVPGDIATAVAWKNGFFRFNDESIEEVMQQISRWYNVDISYQGKPVEERFTGKVSRTKNLSQLLLILEKTKGVHFKIEERRVSVMR
ncbi:FecR family protein [Pedobacter gandavensis]|uniref:FecR family protein n=1 Tax=Pedobacter gandavensis TaxID=2679963 RepID=UPI00292CBFEB|nr:FecR domain-containing protein [Pedobacter gandavensis]